MTTASRTRFRRNRRRGATLVEFAFAAPILIVFSLTLIELARIFTIQNTVENAAMEGARRGIVPGASAAQVQEAALDVLDAVRIRNGRVIVTPAVLTANTPALTVQVQAPIEGNSWIPARFFRGGGLTKTITLTRETSQ